MIHLLAPGDQVQAADIVQAALERSVSHTQVLRSSPDLLAARLLDDRPVCVVFVQPPARWQPLIERCLLARGSKLIVLGALSAPLAALLGAQVHEIPADWAEAARSPQAPSRAMAASRLGISHSPSAPGLEIAIAERPFERFDFTDEWNNLGFGAVRLDGSIWALAQGVRLRAGGQIAAVTLEGAAVGAYAGRWDNVSVASMSASNAILWINRPVGPVDSAEWSMVEHYLAHDRPGELCCQPVLAEIPHGVRSAVTMRLDCDEDIASARALHDLYRELDVPMSLAIHAKVLQESRFDARHTALIHDVSTHGGAILSHTATHAPDWGGSHEAAWSEGAVSAQVIEQVTGQPPRYAVSPFHQTPLYARLGLADAGYAGCIGGIIRNDPDFLMARAGRPPGSGAGFIGHSQQCMLHGDCMLDGDDPLAVFKQAFGIARRSRTFFGYLDHPFSERYAYGWASESERVLRHREFIAFMRSHPDVLFANEDEAMDFLGWRARVELHEMADGRYAARVPRGPAPALGELAIDHRGESVPLSRWSQIA